jgi:hypothetical protein
MDLEEQNEIYRDRFINSFFASYSMIGVLAGIVVAVAAIIRTPDNSWIADFACFLSVIQILLIVLMFHRFRMTYDLLGFAPKVADDAPGHEYNSKTKDYANKSKIIRRVSEKVIHLALLAQIVLLVIAWR